MRCPKICFRKLEEEELKNVVSHRDMYLQTILNFLLFLSLFELVFYFIEVRLSMGRFQKIKNRGGRLDLTDYS